MSLSAQARIDAAGILGNAAHFAETFVLTQPDGFESAEPLLGITGDIGISFDADNQPVTGRRVTLSTALGAIGAAGYTGLPESVPGSAGKPWLAAWGGSTYKVKSAAPDRTLDVHTMILEFYEP